MKGEILSLETTQKLAKYDKAIKYLKEKITEIEKQEKEDDIWDEELRGYLIQRRSDFKEILKMLEVQHEQTKEN